MTGDFFETFCDRCIHRRFEASRGVVCGLTDQRPDTTRPCAELVIDPERAEDVALLQRNRERFETVIAIEESMTNGRSSGIGSGPRIWIYTTMGIVIASLAYLVDRCGR